MNTENNWITLCHKDELITKSGVCALLEKDQQEHQVALFHVDESEVYAVANWDPVGQANVLYRGLVGEEQGEVYVASPLLKQRFSLKNGRCLDDESLAITSFPTRIVDDHVQVKA
jgi:nitrite reductase (NADH) small subunit